MVRANYSNSRLALLEFRRRVEAYQHAVMVWQLCRRIWQRWLDVAVFSGALERPSYDRQRRVYAACAWLPPKWDWVDPLKDARAEIEQIDAGLKSWTQALAERGYDAEQVDAEIATDRARENLRAPASAMVGQLICPQIDVTVEGASDDLPSCDEHNWSGGWYITQTLLSATHSWVGNAVFSSPLGGMQANDALPVISTPLTWGAGAYAYRIQQAPSFPPINGYAGRWLPLTTADVPGHAPYRQGSSISLRYWGHAAGGPTECIVAAERPLIVESGTLSIVDPPEIRTDIAQYPGALTLAFGPITQSGVTFAPVGIHARYVSAGDPGWLGGQRPSLSVLYQVQSS